MQTQTHLAHRAALTVAILFSLLASSWGPALSARGSVAARYHAAGPQPGLRTSETSPAHLTPNYSQMPLYFIENRGQLDTQVAYYLQGSDKDIYFTPQGVTFALTKALSETSEVPQPFAAVAPELPSVRERWAVKLDFVDANPNVQPVGEDPLETVISYFKGNPEDWRTGLRAYSRLVYHNLWPGIDLVYYGTTNQLKYEFVVQPGADPAQIQLAYRGAEVTPTPDGQLEIVTPLGSFRDGTPVAYQEVNGERRSVTMAYALPSTGKDDLGDRVAATDVDQSHLYGFEVGAYDLTRSLILDPVILIYSSFIGGSSYDDVAGVAVDATGNAYIVGSTMSDDFPVVGGPDLTRNAVDIFVVKVNPAGSHIVYAGYIGGSNDDYGKSIALDGVGNAYVTGYTHSTDFPTIGGLDASSNGYDDAIIVKINTTGASLVYSGYLGGSEGDGGNGIAVDAQGYAYVIGETDSTEATFPVVGGPDLTFNGVEDIFVAKVNAAGTALVYAGYVGGADTDHGNSIAVDDMGNAYFTGDTLPYNVGSTYDYDVVVGKVNATGTELSYSWRFGGADVDGGSDIAVDSTRKAYIVGSTRSHNFPVVGGPDLTYNGSEDAFVAKVDETGLIYAGYIGGAGEDRGFGIVLDDVGNVYVTGRTYSTDFPALGGWDSTYHGNGDAFIAKVGAGDATLESAMYLGGSSEDIALDLAVDNAANIYVVGYTNSADFPIVGGFDSTHNDIFTEPFIAKLGVGYTVSGRVTDTVGDCLEDVVLSTGGGYSTTTDISGVYTVALPPGVHTLTPIKSGYHFNPLSRTITVPPDATEQNFTAILLTYTITGRIADGNGVGVVGVTLTDGAGISVTTDGNGRYQIPELLPDAYTLTPAKNDYLFIPEFRTISVPPDAAGQDFVVLPHPVSATLSLSGTVNLPTYLSYVDVQGLTTTLYFPVGVVTETTTLLLTPTLATDAIGWAWAGHVFEIQAFQSSRPLPVLALRQPATVTLHYSASDVRVVSDESQLALWRRTGGNWSDATTTCTPPSGYHRDGQAGVLEVAICQLGHFGLFGPTHQIYLPLVLRK